MLPISNRLRAAALTAILAGGMATPLQAQPTIEDYSALPAVSLMSLSPDGSLIAYRHNGNGRDLLIVRSLADNKNIHALDASALSLQSIRFLSDSELIFTAAEHRRISGFRGHHDVSTAFRLDLDSGDLSQLLTPGDEIYPGQTGLGEIVAISPDRSHIYMPAFVAEHSADRDPELSLMRVRAKIPRNPRVEQAGRPGAVDYFMNDQGALIAQEIYHNRRNLHQVLVPEGNGRWHTVYELETEIRSVSFVGVSPGGESLVFLDEDKDSGRTDYYTLALSDGSIHTTGFGREDRDVEQVLTDLNRVVFGVRYSGFTPSYAFFDPAKTEKMQAISDFFPEHAVWLADWTPDWRKVVVYVAGSNIPGDYYLFDDALEGTFLASARPSLRSEDVHPIGKVTISASDGLRIPTLLTIPRDRVTSMKNLPAVLLPHGGPASYDRIEFDWLAQAFASHGYLVIQPQFRGSKGFGLAHLLAGHGEWGGRMQSDLSEALAFLSDQGIVDPQRVCIVGASYGGYAALAGGAFTPDLYRCVVSINGVSDLRRMLKEERREHGSDHWAVSYWEKQLAQGEVDDKELESLSPVNAAAAFQAPVLLIHGEHDKVVPIKHSRLMQSSLKKAGKSVELLQLDETTHHLLTGETRLQAAQAAIGFVDRHLQQTP